MQHLDRNFDPKDGEEAAKVSHDLTQVLNTLPIKVTMFVNCLKARHSNYLNPVNFHALY